MKPEDTGFETRIPVRSASKLSAFAIVAVATFFWHANAPAAPSNPLTRNYAAPELSGGPWINTPGGKALSLKARRGQVTVVHFWTFACSNCRANLPVYARWRDEFAPRGVAVIGVHSPELPHEKDEANLRREIKSLGIEFPVLVDRDGSNWQRWNQQYWPTIYLIDRQNRVRYVWIGETGDEGAKTMSRRIAELLAEVPK